MQTNFFTILVRLFVSAMMVLILLPRHATAQANQDISFADFQFNRSLPGAKSLGMGGAFVALADDASAAYSNPAGLTNIPTSEISAEFRQWTVSTSIPERGRISGTPTGLGIDTIDGIATSDESFQTEALAFLSFTYVPPNFRKKLALGFYHHVLADFSTRLTSQGVFDTGIIPRFGPYRVSTNFHVENQGISFAHLLGDCVEGGFCLRYGLGLSHFSLSLLNRTEVLVDPPPAGFGEATFDERQIALASTAGEDNDTAINIGILWEINQPWTLGASWRQGPEFAIQERVFAPARKAKLKLPDSWSLGLTYGGRHGKSESNYNLSFEYSHVTYSSIIEDNGFSVFDLNDGDEWRIGLEWIRPGFLQKRDHFLILRSGIWLDPAHTIGFDNDPVTNIDRFRTAFFDASSKDEWHWSVGIGLRLDSFQADIGFDFSDLVETIATSIVYKF